MHLDKAVRIKKSFNLDSVKMVSTGEELPRIQLTGYASRGFTDTGHKAIDLDGETINQYGIDVSRLETGNIPLLFQHDQSKIVGKVLSASYDTKGLFVTAELTKLPGDSLTNYVYEAVKAGLLNSFSVGLMVEEIDWAEDDIIEITKSYLFELSVVSTPALASATFNSTVIKSADGLVAKAVVDVNALKEDNPDMCDTLGCLLKSAKKEEEMPAEKIKTEVTKSEVKDEETVVESPATEPEVEPETPKEEEIPKEEVDATEGEEKPKEEEAPSKTSDKPAEEVEISDPEPVVEDPAPAEEPEVSPEPVVEEGQMTLEDAISLLSGIKIEDLTDEELEVVFETVSTLTEAVEKKVVAEIAATMFAEEQAED